MSVIGVRCWGDRIAWVVLDGTLSSPSVIAHSHCSAPAGTRAEQLDWLRREIIAIAQAQRVNVAFYREVEGQARGPSTVRRYEFHGVLQEAWHFARPDCPIEPRLRSQVRRDTRFGGRASEIEEGLIFDTPLDALPRAHYADAVLVALCGLQP